MVYYRKYRPQTINDLDNESVRETLSAVLSKDPTAHAFLFTGPKGLGKTSTARIVAKILNCEKRKKGSVEPCNTCDQCVSITNGNNLDVMEIDGASHRGIDEIRDLREKIRLSPVSARKKVYIIDEVHMLTTEAFNALLKTLEEPPSHVVFILCTTELHKVPETIQSRCFQVSFTRATNEELSRSLKRIAKGEKIDVDDDGLLAIAHFADGSFRDAAKIFEEIVALAGRKKITAELVGKQYHSSGVGTFIEELLPSLRDRDTKKSLEIIQKLTDQGVDLKYFLEELIQVLHKAMLQELGIVNDELKGKREGVGLREIKKLIALFSKAYGDIKFSPIPQLPLEIALIEWGTQDAPGPVASSVSHSSSSVDSSLRALAGTPSGRATPREGGFLDQLIAEVKKENHSVAGVLRGCAILEQDNKHIVLQAAYKFHKDKLEENIKLLEKACSEIIGKQLNVSIVLKGGE